MPRHHTVLPHRNCFCFWSRGKFDCDIKKTSKLTIHETVKKHIAKKNYILLTIISSESPGFDNRFLFQVWPPSTVKYKWDFHSLVRRLHYRYYTWPWSPGYIGHHMKGLFRDSNYFDCCVTKFTSEQEEGFVSSLLDLLSFSISILHPVNQIWKQLHGHSQASGHT